MDAFIYFHSQLDIDRDEVEGAIEKIFQGKVEVTGGGSGATGSNIDLDISDGSMTAEEAFRIIKLILDELEIKAKVTMNIGGRRFIC